MSIMSLLAIGLGPVLLVGGTITNGDFEAKGTAESPAAGWSIDVGATNDGLEPLSSVEQDHREHHKGRASLRLHGDDTTRAWRIVTQDIPVRTGGNYKLRAFAKAEKVRGEAVQGTSIWQFQNCYVGLFFENASGEVIAKEVR